GERIHRHAEEQMRTDRRQVHLDALRRPDGLREDVGIVHPGRERQALDRAVGRTARIDHAHSGPEADDQDDVWMWDLHAAAGCDALDIAAIQRDVRPERGMWRRGPHVPDVGLAVPRDRSGHSVHYIVERMANT